jgi:hypothetical protein
LSKLASALRKYISRPSGVKVGDDSYPDDEIAAGVQCFAVLVCCDHAMLNTKMLAAAP